ncbi:MAG: radical SAM protein [Candidatus Aminicenantes bacterium]|nr:radical SAM protein [Candidatus Aminicenantes bacterium]
MLKSSSFNRFATLSDGRKILFNFLTLRLVALEGVDAARVESVLSNPVLPPRRGTVRLTQLLQHNGFLVDEASNEASQLMRGFHQSREDESLLSLTILPTLSCNFRCTYCYEGEPAPEHMGGEVEAALVAFVEDRLRRGGRMSVCWYGGEPLLRKETVDTLSRAFLDLCAARDVSYQASVITNGYLLDRATASWLKGLGVGLAQVTLDGPPQVHDLRRPLATGGGTFRTIIDNLKAVSGLMDINVRMNVDAENQEALGLLLDLLVEEGIAERVTLYPAMTDSFTSTGTCVADQCLGREKFSLVSLRTSLELTRRGLPDRLVPMAHSLPCGALRRATHIVTPSGGLAACWARVTLPGKHIGHLLQPATADMEERRKEWFSFDPFALECRDCFALPICMGACPEHYLVRRKLDCPVWKHHPEEHILNYYRLLILQRQSEIAAGCRTVVDMLRKQSG